MIDKTGLVPGTLVIPMNWLDEDRPWDTYDNERSSLDASEPACDHRGTMRTIRESCECGESLCVSRFPSEQA